MKTLHLLLAASFMLASTAVSAKTLEVTVSDIRNDKGNILVMAKVAGQEQPVYGMAAAKAGKVVVTLEGIEADAAELSLFHDEDGDYKLKMATAAPPRATPPENASFPPNTTRPR